MGGNKVVIQEFLIYRGSNSARKDGHRKFLKEVFLLLSDLEPKLFQHLQKNCNFLLNHQKL